VIDAGQVGTEMLYFLVGSRELDGGLMCTASHNPKAYTGAKLVREGAIALSGDSGIQDIRREIGARGRAGRDAAGRRARARSRRSTSTRSSRRPRCVHRRRRRALGARRR
jgi:phosphomannomutase